MHVRQSFAAVALIRREAQGQVLWLTRWNVHWNSFHLIAGHKRPDESFRDCLRREIVEELALRERTDFTVADEPLLHLEYTAWSERAHAETAYTAELFPVQLAGESVCDRPGDDPRVRWVSG